MTKFRLPLTEHHDEEDRGGSPVARPEADRRRRRQSQLAVYAETPFVPVGIARVQVRVGKGMAVGRVLVGADKARRQRRFAAAVEHGGVGVSGPQGTNHARADA